LLVANAFFAFARSACRRARLSSFEARHRLEKVP